MAKRKSPYFDDFNRMVACSCKAAEHLKKTLREFSPDTFEEKCELMHQIENEEDDIKHEMMERLVKEFIPPIDREDIIDMSHHLDNVTDKIEEIVMRMHMYNVQTLRTDANTYADIIVKMCDKLKIAVEEFPNFHKSGTLKEKIIEINTIEEEGDRLYMKAVRELFEQEGDPIQIFAWSKIFDLMEDCCDACEHVANVMEMVIMKNG